MSWVLTQPIALTSCHPMVLATKMAWDNVPDNSNVVVASAPPTNTSHLEKIPKINNLVELATFILKLAASKSQSDTVIPLLGIYPRDMKTQVHAELKESFKQPLIHKCS